MDLHPGALVGRKYRLLRRIGEGSMCVVWAAVNEDTCREVAIKLLARPTEGLAGRLQREARECGALRHRNIIDVYDFERREGSAPFLVTQLLVGETLRDRLARERRVAPREAARIGRDVARALGAAHSAGVIHRDIKPANVFLHNEEGSLGEVVKVLDFGVCKNLVAPDDLMTMVGGQVGSPAYMSPEQARGARDLDHRADLWSLGVVLFEMLAGVRPFVGSSMEIAAQVAAGEIPSLALYAEHIDAGLIAVVTRCLKRSPAERVSSAAELEAALDPYAKAADALVEIRRPNEATASLAAPAFAFLPSKETSPPAAAARNSGEATLTLLPESGTIYATSASAQAPPPAIAGAPPEAPSRGATPVDPRPKLTDRSVARGQGAASSRRRSLERKITIGVSAIAIVLLLIGIYLQFSRG